MASTEHSTLTTTTPNRSSRISAILAAVMMACAVLFTGGTAAQAHDQLVSTDPAQDATIDKAPDHVTLTYSGEITDVQNGNKVIVTDSTGKTVSSGDSTVNGREVTQKMSSDAKDETYKVAWRVVSQDGHPIEGSFTFTVGKGGSGNASSASANASTGASSGSSSADSDSSDHSQKSGLPVWVSAVIGAIIALGVLVVVALLVARVRARKSDEENERK